MSTAEQRELVEALRGLEQVITVGRPRPPADLAELPTECVQLICWSAAADVALRRVLHEARSCGLLGPLR
ncbi:MAG: hypothetical protein AMXMBFR77_27760 [Phycisphaerales bacterium]